MGVLCLPPPDKNSFPDLCELCKVPRETIGKTFVTENSWIIFDLRKEMPQFDLQITVDKVTYRVVCQGRIVRNLRKPAAEVSGRFAAGFCKIDQRVLNCLVLSEYPKLPAFSAGRNVIVGV